MGPIGAQDWKSPVDSREELGLPSQESRQEKMKNDRAGMTAKVPEGRQASQKQCPKLRKKRRLGKS